jgi:hypothetical protein
MAHNQTGDALRGWEFGMGRKWGGNGEGEVSSRATWDQGGRDRTTQEEGFQVSKMDSKGRRNQQGELTKRNQRGVIGKGLHLHLILLTCVYILYHCMNAANKRMCLGYK